VDGNQADTGKNVRDPSAAEANAENLKSLADQLGDDKSSAAQVTAPAPTAAAAGTSSSNLPAVQRATNGRSAPSSLARMRAWLATKFGGIKRRVAQSIAQVQAKLTTIMLKLVGLASLQSEMRAGIEEKDVQAVHVSSAVSDAQTSVKQYAVSADQFAQQVNTARPKANAPK
jgi:hypothetical protein